MGAVLSLPFSMAGTAIASFAGSSVSSILGSMFSSVFGATMSGIAARIAYALLFMFNSLLSWLTLSSYVQNKIPLLKYACKSEGCASVVDVHRINSSLGMLHLVLAAILSYKYRTTIQNGWWRTKIFGYFAALVLTFFIPAGFWINWGTYVAPVMSFVFVFIGLILLVDAAHSWTETCIEHIEEEGEDERFWRFVLVGSTVGMYLGVILLSIVMYAKFATAGCNMNQAAASLNIIFAVIVSVMSVHPTVQEYNPKAGLSQAAMVSVYCTYLILSAVTSEPDDMQCNPWARSGKTRGFSTALGGAFTFVAIAYTTTRAASRAIIGDTDDIEAGSISLTSESRREALQQAVREGSLPESALDDAQWVYEDSEASSDGYNYVIFHIVFLLATQYTASILTVNVSTDPLDDFVPVGRSYFASWMKIIASWICYALYSWSLIAPVLMPDRF